MKKKAFICLLCFIGLFTATEAQPNKETERKKRIRLQNEYRKHPPKALLVQIFTHERLMKHYVNSNQTKKEKALKRDIIGVKNALVADFTDNFNYCPVYFFYDTSASKIREGKFDGVLLDNNLQPAKNIILNPKDTNFLVTYFGRISQENVGYTWGWNGTPTSDDDDDLYYSVGSNLRQAFRLVVLDHNFMQLPSYTEIRDAVGIGRKYRHLDKYSYNSSILNVYYWAFAGILSRKLSAFYTLK